MQTTSLHHVLIDGELTAREPCHAHKFHGYDREITIMFSFCQQHQLAVLYDKSSRKQVRPSLAHPESRQLLAEMNSPICVYMGAPASSPIYLSYHQIRVPKKTNDPESAVFFHAI